MTSILRIETSSIFLAIALLGCGGSRFGAGKTASRDSWQENIIFSCTNATPWHAPPAPGVDVLVSVDPSTHRGSWSFGADFGEGALLSADTLSDDGYFIGHLSIQSPGGQTIGIIQQGSFWLLQYFAEYSLKSLRCSEQATDVNTIVAAFGPLVDASAASIQQTQDFAHCHFDGQPADWTLPPVTVRPGLFGEGAIIRGWYPIAFGTGVTRGVFLLLAQGLQIDPAAGTTTYFGDGETFGSEILSELIVAPSDAPKGSMTSTILSDNGRLPANTCEIVGGSYAATLLPTAL